MPSSDDATTSDETSDETGDETGDETKVKNDFKDKMPNSSSESDSEETETDSEETETEKSEMSDSPDTEDDTDDDKPVKSESDSETEVETESKSESGSESESGSNSETDKDETDNTKDETDNTKDETTESSDSESTTDDDESAGGIFSSLKAKMEARKERKKAEKAATVEAKKEAAKPVKQPKMVPITWYYTDLPRLTADFGYKSVGTEHAMMAVGICSKTRPTAQSDPHNIDNTLTRLLETGEWDEMGHWDKKGRFAKALNKRKKTVLNCKIAVATKDYKSRDYSGPPRNMTEHIYIDHAIHPSTPFAHFSGGPLTKLVLGQNLYADFADTIDRFKRPYSSGSEETGLKEDGFFLFVYTVNKT